MKLSTRGMYGLEACVYLATKPMSSYTSLRAIAKNRKVSVKYLEQIFSVLKEEGLVFSMRGKDGGYQLAKHPSQVTAYDVLALLEVDWQTQSSSLSPSITSSVLSQLQQEITAVLHHYTLEELAVAYQQSQHTDFVI